jgi:putative ABC transport system ATP-binding protein
MFLRADRLSRVYGSDKAAVVALGGATFEVAEGEFAAIMGPSGSGKSTLMNLIGLLDRPTSGILTLFGQNVTTLSHDALSAIRNQRIGFVFQGNSLLGQNTALENVELPLVYAGAKRRERRSRASTALRLVGLSHRSGHWPAQLSGGEQQRVAIARALVNKPKLILADEPTGALDSRTGLVILALFQALNRRGSTILMVTHDIQVARHAQRILRMHDGNLVSDGRVEESLDAATGLTVGIEAGLQPAVSL